MDITSIHKYIALNKQPNGSTEVLFAGQPCLTVTENMLGNIWKINPVFAKLVYGANIFEDIPQCIDPATSREESVAAGLIKLYELGAFRTEVDLPVDSYAETMEKISEDVKHHTIKSSKSILEAYTDYVRILKSIKNNTFPVLEDTRSEYIANSKLRDTKHVPIGTGKFILKHPFGNIISRHDSENDAVNSFRQLKDTNGVKILREENKVETDITDQLISEDSKKEKQEEKEVVSAIKKDKKFISKPDCEDKLKDEISK